MPGAREDLLSYKWSLVKITVSALVFILRFSFNFSESINFLLIIFCLIGLWLAICGLGEMLCTYENRKLKKIKSINPKKLKSMELDYEKFFATLKHQNIVFCIFKNETDVYKVGADVVYKDKRYNRRGEIDYKYYYIDDIKDKRRVRTKFREYQEFKRAVNQLNGNKDIFDVISVDKIVIRMK